MLRALLSSLLLACCLWFQPAQAATFYQVNTGATVTITEHSACAVVTNSHASGLALFVPTATPAEWTAFRAAPGAGVTAVTCDTTPDAFNFVDVTGAALGAVITSANITIAGINTATAVTISGAGAQFSINGGAWGTTGNITNGQTLAVRTTSSASASTAVTATVTVGGTSDTWSVTTGAGSSSCGGAYAWTTSTGATNLWAIDLNYNGSKMIGGGYGGYDGRNDFYSDGPPRYSANGGTSWSNGTPLNGLWTKAAFSANGVNGLMLWYDTVHTTANGGANFTSRSITSYVGGAVSSDGLKMVVAGTSYIFTSVNSGANWTQRTAAGSRDWRGAAITDDGNTIVAIAYVSGGNTIFKSTDGGATWSNIAAAGSRRWTHIDMSPDGTKIFAVAEATSGWGDGKIFRSTDSGVTWTELTAAGAANMLISMSDDGMVVATVDNWSNPRISTNGGTTWTTHTTVGTSSNSPNIAVSGNGKVVATAIEFDGIHKYACP